MEPSNSRSPAPFLRLFCLHRNGSVGVMYLHPQAAGTVAAAYTLTLPESILQRDSKIPEAGDKHTKEKLQTAF